MNISQYLINYKEIQQNLMRFLDDEENFENIIQSIKNKQILNEKNELKSILYLISNIANNHKRSTLFNNKIEKVIKYCQQPISNLLSNKEIFDIFSENKRILLYLIKEKIIKIDKAIFSEMTSEKYNEANYSEYFSPELSIFDDSDKIKDCSKKFQQQFEMKRENGENDHIVCQLIRQDSIKEFQEFIVQNRIHLDSKIEKSVFETNSFLNENNPTLIEYAAFFGSYEIFKYLIKNEVKLSKSIWIYGIHGNNVEIFKLLDENHIKPEDESYEECLEESIKCHHNDIAYTIIDNFLDETIEKSNRENNEKENIYSYCFHYYNYLFFPETFDNKFIIYYLIDYDYYNLFKLYLSKKTINYSPIMKYSKRIGKIEYYNILSLLKGEESKPIEKSIPTSTKYNNLNLSFFNDTFQIGSTTIKIQPIKKDYFLGLNEAFSCTTDEAHFLKSSEIFKSIVDSGTNIEYTKIAKEIENQLSDARENPKCKNELGNLISALCKNVSNADIDKMINECGGMINYIIPMISSQKLLSPKKISIEIKEPFISAGLIMFYHEVVQSDLYKNTPFSFWKLMKDGTIKLTYIARNRISLSKNPSIVLLFGKSRTGKSTIASHIISGMKYNFKNTLFKSAASIESCTHNINALGPLKCSDMSSSFELNIGKSNSNMNRDIFIVDSEGVESFDETPWLKQALFAMFPINTTTFYVSRMYNPGELEEYTKYLNLIQIIGGIKINHGFGYILNRGTFDGNKIIDKLITQNENETKTILQSITDESIKFDEEHSKYFTILDFIEHRDEYFISLKEVVKFIINMVLNEGLLMTGTMMIEMLEKFADKTNENQYLKNHGQTFENLFLQIMDNKMQQSIDDQKKSIENIISQQIEPILIRDMTLDIDTCMSKIDQKKLVDKMLQYAIDNTLPCIPQKYPYLIESSKSKALDIIKNSVIDSKQKILNKNALEVPDLGNGYSITDGSFKMKVFDLKTASYLYEKDIGNNVHVVYRFPDFITMNCIPIKYQNNNYNMKTSLKNYVSEIASKIGNGKVFKFSLANLGFERANDIANSLFGITFSTNSPEKELNISVNVNSFAQVYFNSDVNLKKHLNPDLKSLFDELEELLEVHDIKSVCVQNKAGEIFSDFGEVVATKFLIGNYEMDITHNKETKIESGGQNAFSSCECKSSGINLFGLINTGTTKSIENDGRKSQHSIIQNISKSRTIITCGSPKNPATFMYDFVKNSTLGSSFVPLSKFAPSKAVEEALNYWAGRWDFKPKTISEYLYVNDLSCLPIDETITLYNNNMPYELYVNEDGKIVLPDSEIVYHHFRKYNEKIEIEEDEKVDILIDPEDMTIGNLTKTLYSQRWKKRTGHHKRAYGFEHLSLHISLGPLWKFDDDINEAYFKGSALNVAIINNPDSHFLSVEFEKLSEDHVSGKKWEIGPYYLQLQEKIKIRRA